LGLAQATDRASIVQDQFNNEASALTGPLFATGLNLAGAAHQPPFDIRQAQNTLGAAGWTPGRDGIRSKDGKRLKIKLVTQADSPYSPVAKALAEQWKQAGAELDVVEVGPEKLQQSYIRPRNYDALLYGINLGADPDVYAYWSSSQIKDPGLNISVYSSRPADNALESGRILRDPALRAAKYRSFIQAWVGDTPAVMLYTPSYEYGVDDSVYGVAIRKLLNPSDRFTGIEKWSVKVREVPRH
ncbi:MAG TPA: ABC transporter substrate-binding protein, partial [Candidatus Polarisedimenticolaceae bacterium]|nr:ABC transporter substrate-binding protein [Candidatus Polarisedimenticolaceae bacterium]